VDAHWGDDEPEVFDSVCVEGTLQDLGAKVSFTEVLEYTMNVATVLFKWVRENEYVIKIYDDEKVNHVLEWVIHEVLELYRGIGRTHGHDEPLVGAIPCVESCKPLMAFSDSDVVIAIMKVNFGINCGMTKAVEELVDEGERVVALLCDSIECAIVAHRWSPPSFFFANRISTPAGDVEGWMNPLERNSLMNLCSAASSTSNMGYPHSTWQPSSISNLMLYVQCSRR
jgi:hypothetical protein